MHLRKQLLLLAAALVASTPRAQTLPPTLPSSPPTALPAFEVATIKPVDPKGGGVVGFLSRPGGRIILGNASVRMILYYAFHVQEYQIAGGPDWMGTDKYNIEAVPPDTASSRTAKQPDFAASPSNEQRKMLQNLLMDRFALKSHTEIREGDVYILTRSSKVLELDEPKHPEWDSRGQLRINGEAFGQNIPIDFLTDMLSQNLSLPVLDQTGLTGSYDFQLPANDPENRDMASAVVDEIRRLGLSLKRGRGPVSTLVIDHIERPSAN